MTMQLSRGSIAGGAAGGEEFDAAALDAAVAEVSAHVSTWAKTAASARAELLDRVLRDTRAASEGWLADACEAKGLAPDSPEAGEELFAGIVTFERMARLLRDSIVEIGQTARPTVPGRPRYPGPVTEAPDGRVRVGVFPATIADKVMFMGTTAEVWMQPGVTREDVDAGQAQAYRDPQAHEGVSLVLGAGNVASLGPRDVLAKLFVEGKVVVLKSNPVNEYLVPHWTRAMRALIDAGVLRIVTGGTEVGTYLVNHPQIDEIHITGSDKTHDAIVFGTGEVGLRRKQAADPVVTKPVTCELGNVSPVIVAPGRWSSADLLYQAEHVASMIVNNAGFNCLTPRVIVTHASWPQREAFLGALAQTLTRIPTRRAYYPGAAARRDSFLAAHADALEMGPAGEGILPWTIVRDVDPGKLDDICFNVEAFCGLTAEAALTADSPAAFIDAAVEFCNDVLWGTLSATILVHPGLAKDPKVADAAERAIANLRYGSIGYNIWHGMSFAIGSTTWGAYPGHAINDIQSGTGVVGNAYMFDRPQKSVVRGPWRARPKPIWFATQSRPLPVARRLLGYEQGPSAKRLAAIVGASLRTH